MTVPSLCKEGGLIDAGGRGSITDHHGWFLELTLSTPQRWEHCRWLFNQTTDDFPPPAVECGNAFDLLVLK